MTPIYLDAFSDTPDEAQGADGIVPTPATWTAGLGVRAGAEEPTPAELAQFEADCRKADRVSAVILVMIVVLAISYTIAHWGETPNEIKTQTRATELPLSICYRCPRVVVEAAQRLQPEIEAAPGAKEGSIYTVEEVAAVQMLRPGDAVLCRVNAPLVGIWFDLLAREVPAKILGRDVEGQINKSLDAIEGIEGYKFKDFHQCAERYRAVRVAALEARQASEGQILSLNDQIDALRELYARSVARGAKSLADLRNRVREMFDERGVKVVLSSIHKAKGAEWPKVFVWKPHLLPHPMASTPDAREQERNLEYVAITRAQDTLVWVEDPTAKKRDEQTSMVGGLFDCVAPNDMEDFDDGE